MSSNAIRLIGEGRVEEDVGSGAIKPGMLLEKFTSSGDVKVKAHSTSGGFAERAVAVEDALQGKTVDDAYTSGDRVSYLLGKPGDVVQMILNAGEDVDVGDQLISNGDGTVIKATGTPKQIIGSAEEAKDLSASGAVDTLIAVRLW